MPSIFKRGEIWLVNFGSGMGREQTGIRPAVILSSDFLAAEFLGLLMVVPGTTRARRTRNGDLVPNHVEVSMSASSGLDSDTYFMSEQLKSVSIERFQRRLGMVDTATIEQLEKIISKLLLSR